MKFEKFRLVVENNKKNQASVYEKVKDFYSQMGMEYETDLLSFDMIIKPLYEKRNFLLIEMPLKDEEIGGISFRSGKLAYTILNSSLPKVNVNFALAHEIYHLFYQKELIRTKVEFYVNGHYFDYEEEREANQFAGLLLMPEKFFRQSVKRFLGDMAYGESYLSVVVKLMHIYNAPFAAVLIRLYELELIPDGEVLKELLSAGHEQIKGEFYRLWLDDGILCPTKKDDFRKLEFLVQNVGALNIDREILSEETVKRITVNIRKIYDRIRG